MTPEYPVYHRLIPLLPNAQVVDFLQPADRESLTAYAKRMARLIPKNCFIAGVSFGGILAQEIARIVQPSGCIMIASISSPRQLPPWLRAWRMMGGRNRSRILNGVGSAAKLVPRQVSTRSTMRITKLSEPEGAWHRWATSAVLNWNPDPMPIPSPVLHIHGDADTTFPVRYTTPDVVIAGGRHALPVSHPADTANAIINFTRTVS